MLAEAFTAAGLADFSYSHTLLGHASNCGMTSWLCCARGLGLAAPPLGAKGELSLSGLLSSPAFPASFDDEIKMVLLPLPSHQVLLTHALTDDGHSHSLRRRPSASSRLLSFLSFFHFLPRFCLLRPPPSLCVCASDRPSFLLSELPGVFDEGGVSLLLLLRGE